MTSRSKAERDQRLDAWLDRQEILDCLTRVSRGMDRFDKQLFLSGYHADAVIDAGAFVGRPDEVYDGGAALHAAGQSATLHNLMNHSCEIEGDVAHAETYYLYVGRNRDGGNWLAGGRYADRLERRDGAWRIAFRCTVVEWSGLVPAVAVPLFEGVADLHLNGVAARSREDLSYRRPLENRRPLRLPDDPGGLGDPTA